MAYNILVVEDDEDIRANIIAFLNEEGYDADELPDGDHLLEKVSENNYDLVICDVMMPGLDGFELFSLVQKEFGIQATPPFIFLTSKSERSDYRKAMELGADDFITKPYRVSELRRAIETQIKKRNELLSEDSIDVVKEKTSNISVDLDEKEKMSYSSNIFAEMGDETVILKVRDIIYIQAGGNYTYIYSIKGKNYTLRKTLDTWEKALPKEQFIRIRRNIIINMEFISKIEKWYNYTYRIYLDSFNAPHDVSQRYARMLRAKLDKYL